ncbi:MAG: tol-pal system YbgF family protein [Terriglobales bacterium]
MRTSERRQLKQDKFAETTKETISWAVEHRAALVTTLVVVGVAMAAIIGGLWYWKHNNTAANAALGKAMQIYEAPVLPGGAPDMPGVLTFTSAQERARAAHNEFQKIADQYGRTAPGKLARYMAAMTSIQTGDAKSGEQQLQQVVSSGNKEIAGLAKLSLAGIYRDSNRAKDAIPLYKDLIANSVATVPKVTAQLELAAVYEATGQPGEASKLYQEIIKESPQSPAAMTANQKLGSLTK